MSSSALPLQLSSRPLQVSGTGWQTHFPSVHVFPFPHSAGEQHSAAQLSPQFRALPLQVKPHLLPSHVAVAPVGARQAWQLEPHVLGSRLLAQVPLHSWVPDGQVHRPSEPHIWPPPQSCGEQHSGAQRSVHVFPELHLKLHCWPSHEGVAPDGALQGEHPVPHVMTLRSSTHAPLQSCVPGVVHIPLQAIDSGKHLLPQSCVPVGQLHIPARHPPPLGQSESAQQLPAGKHSPLHGTDSAGHPIGLIDIAPVPAFVGEDIMPMVFGIDGSAPPLTPAICADAPLMAASMLMFPATGAFVPLIAACAP